MARRVSRANVCAIALIASFGTLTVLPSCTIEESVPSTTAAERAALADSTTTATEGDTTVPLPADDSSTSNPTQSTSTAAPTTSTSPASTTTPDPRPLALDVLALIPVENERPDGYSRDLFDHWITRNGCTTRESVLIRESVTFPQVDPVGCTVVAGDWTSPYDGATWTDPSDLDIDHVVALKEAWDSGAWAWSSSRRRDFANDLTDPRTLRAVTDNVNQSKSDADPSNWMPPLRSYWCTYLGDWVSIKARWGLSMDQSEWGRIRNLLRDECPGWRIEPVAPAPG